MKKRLTAMLMVVALLVSLLSTGAMAVEGEPGTDGDKPVTEVSTSSNGITINKKVTTENGQSSLSIEAYVQGSVSAPTTQPLDIVLVLDQSGSMSDPFGSTSRQAAMKQAVQEFISSVAANSGDKHQMAIVTFGTGSDTLRGWTTVDATGAQSLSSAVNGLDNPYNQATNVAAGMERAESLMNSARDKAEKVVIVFTDGVPTTSSEFSTSVANNAIETAYGLKQGSVTIYTIGIFGGADPNQLYGSSGFDKNSDGTIDSQWIVDEWGLFPGWDFPEADVPAANRFLNYLSSNYANSESIGLNRETGGLGLFHSTITYTITENFTRGEGNYYLTASDSDDLTAVFEQIAGEITPSVNVGADAVLTDTMSDYFVFGTLGSGSGDYSNVTVEVYNATGNGNSPAWEKDNAFVTSGINVSVEGETINVTGFDYSAYPVVKNDGTWQGKKLVITFPIQPDADATWGPSGNYDTNAASSAGLQDSNDQFFTGGMLTDSPEAYVQTYSVDYEFVSGTDGKTLPDDVTSLLEEPDQEYFLSGTNPTNELDKDYNPVDDGTGTWTPADEWTEAKDAYGNVTYTLIWTYKNNYTPGSPITVKVVVDGQEVDNDSTYIDVTAWDDRTEKFDKTNDTNGDFSISFEYDKYNAADFQITNESDLILQAISADLIGGTSGSGGIKAGENNTYTLDNVDGGSTVTVYLYTPYTVKYYVNDVESVTITDLATYIVDSKTASGTAPDTSGDVETLVTATFADNASSIELKDLPTETGKTYSGWFLGSSTGQQQVSPVDVETASTSATDEDVIEFYATSTDNDYTVRYNPNLPDGATGIETPNTTTHNYNDTVTLDETITSSTTVKVGHDTYTFSGWTTAKTESGTSVSISNNTITMPAENVIVSGAWTKTSSDPTFDVTYKWENNVAPSDASLPEGETGKYEGDEITVANGYDPITGTNSDGVPGTWTFDGWTSTNVDVSSGSFTMPADNVIITGKWTFTPNSYTITVEVENGTSDPADSTISVQHGDDQTIKFTANEGYALDSVTVDGETDSLTDGKYTFDSITADHNIVVVFAKDSNGDDIPDYKQVIVYFEADENGSVDGELTQAFTANEGEGTVTFTPEYVTPNANTGYAFDIWTKDNGEEGVNPFTPTTAEAGTTITYTAHFAKDEIGGEDGGDDIPDKYQATIVYNVVNGTWDGKTNTPITYIVDTAIYDDTTGKWNLTNATLAAEDRPIPTGMVPNATHIAPGTWDKTPDGEFVLVGEQTYEYTHTFSTLVDYSYSVTKTAKVGDTVLSGDSYVQVGDTITYTITVENTGNVALSNITLTDTFTGGNGTLNFDDLPEGVTVDGGKITITSIAVGSKVEITATYKVVDGDKTLTNTVADGEGKKTTVTTDVADLDVTKTVSDESVNVGDTINYTITVKNTGNVELTDVVVSDEMLPATGVTVTGIDSNNYTVEKGEVTITTLPVGSTVTITYSYTTTEADATNGVTNSVTVKAGDDGPEGNDETETTVTDYTVTIAPADIVIYTGGDGYGGVIDDNGNLIEASESSGLPEPGYHLDLSEDLVQWLTDNGVTVSDGDTPAEHLENIIHFEYWEDVYGVSTMTRRWDLEYMGIYETDEAIGEPTRYVYRLVSVNDNQLPVRLAYGNGELITDDIVMSENSVSETHDITIYAGGIEQGNVIAVAKIPQTDGSEAKVKVNCSTEVGTGKLTIRSTVDDGNSNTAINATPSTDAVTAHTNGEVTFYVNDTEVIVDKNRVQLLLDQVSNNADFNAAMGEDAIATVLENNNLSDASYQLVYMDLVDTQNGNAVVTMGVGDSLKIYWPVPDDAASGSDFYIVHYYEMNREGTIDDIGNAATHQERATVEVVDGQRYVTFDVNSFSPFVLVYETDDGYEPIIPTPDDDTEYVPKWLNTEDHFAYIVGYEDGEVKPNNNITRAEVATIFFRLLTDDARARYWSQTNDYTDVAADSWYNNAISTLSNMGIINGYEDGTFKPNAPITRAEFTAIATRFFDYTAEYEGAFNDVSRSAWYADCVQAAVDMGLVDGYPDGGFHPNSNITRAEAVTIVNRVLNRAPHEDHLLDEDEMNVWPDNVYGAWYYADMQEATNSHDYDWIRVSGERVEEWTEKLPERDWAALEQEWSSAYSG